MIFFILSLYKLDKIISKEIKNRYGTVITIAVMIILNVFSFEMFLYIEKGIMVLSVFLCILALEQVIRFFNGKKSGIIWGLLFMFIANCCYQGNVGIFLSIAIVFAMKYSDNLDTRREVLAYAAMEFAGCAVGCCPINGSVSRSGIADQFGCRSQLMSITASFVRRRHQHGQTSFYDGVLCILWIFFLVSVTNQREFFAYCLRPSAFL